MGIVAILVTVIPAKMQWGRYNLFKWFVRFITWVIDILLQLGDTKPSKLQAAGTQFPAGLTPAALSTLYSVPYLWSVDARISTELAKAGVSPVIHLWSNSVPLFCLATQLSIFREARWNVAATAAVLCFDLSQRSTTVLDLIQAWNAFESNFVTILLAATTAFCEISDGAHFCNALYSATPSLKRLDLACHLFLHNFSDCWTEHITIYHSENWQKPCRIRMLVCSIWIISQNVFPQIYLSTKSINIKTSI